MKFSEETVNRVANDVLRRRHPGIEHTPPVINESKLHTRQVLEELTIDDLTIDDLPDNAKSRFFVTTQPFVLNDQFELHKADVKFGDWKIRRGKTLCVISTGNEGQYFMLQVVGTDDTVTTFRSELESLIVGGMIRQIESRKP